MARRHFSGGALTAPVPPVLVTVGNEKEANIITIGWTGILATHPPRTYISVRPERHSYEMLRLGKEFVINLASASLVKKVDYCGIFTGAKVDKFEKCGFTKEKSREVAPPTIAECPIALECRVAEVIPMGTHDVFIADIVSVSCDESVLDEKGKICFDKADLLAYAHGEYFKLGEVLDKFGFSASKNKPAARKNAQSKEQAKEKALQSKAYEEPKQEKKRPFYLDVPRGKNKGKSGGVSKNRSVRGKKK